MQSGVVPLRPLTLGELLDAAVALLRRHARVYLPIALGLAAAEQALLVPLRLAADAQPPYFLPYSDRLGQYWLLLATGFGSEMMIIALLGGLTARAAGAEITGAPLPARQLVVVRGSRFGVVLVVALIVGVVGWLAALACWLPWVGAYGLLGLAAPAVVIDRLGPGRALLRSIRLSGRDVMAAFRRLVGYVAWLAIRVGLGVGSIALLRLALPETRPGWLLLAAAVAWGAVNSVAYPALACLDAVLHLETRIRTEGLDLALSRAARTGRPAASVLETSP